MHEHFTDMFSTSEFGIRFREFGRLDEVGGPGTMAKPAASPAPAAATPAAPAATTAAVDHAAELAAKKAADAAAAPKASDSTDAKKGADAVKKPADLTVGQQIGGALEDAVKKPAIDVSKVMVDHAKDLATGANEMKKAGDGFQKINDDLNRDLAESAKRNEGLTPGQQAGGAIQDGLDAAGHVIGNTAGAIGGAIGATANAAGANLGTAVDLLDTLPGTPSLKGGIDGANKANAIWKANSDQTAAKLAETAKKNDQLMKEAGDGFAQVRANADKEQQRIDAANNREGLTDGQKAGGQFLDNLGNSFNTSMGMFGAGANAVGKTAEAAGNSIGAAVNAVTDKIGADFNAVGSFIGGIFGGGSSDKPAGADDKESEQPASKPVTSGSSSTSQADHADAAATDKGNKAQVEHAEASVTPNKAQVEREQELEAKRRAQQTVNGSGADQKPNPTDAPVTRTAPPVDVARPEGRAMVLAKAQEAHLVPAGTTFADDGSAVYVAQPGDHYWGLTQQATGTGNANFDYGYWNQLQLSNGSTDGALYAGQQVVLPGRSVSELAKQLGL